MVAKEFISPKKLTHDSFVLAKNIHDSGFKPDHIIVLWRGGTPVGCIVEEFLHYKGIVADHHAIKAKSYTGIGEKHEVLLQNISWLIDSIDQQTSVLLVDDIFDSGRTMEKVKQEFLKHTPNVKVATLYYKPKNNETQIQPDYFVEETEQWVVFPHELLDLSNEEIKQKDSFVHQLLSE